MISKKGQINGVIAFVGIVVLLLILAPFLMKLVLSPVDKLSSAFSNIDSSNKSVEATSFIRGKFTGMFDWVIMAAFMFSVILLLVTSFLVDIHPAFLLVYIVAFFCIMAFSPALLSLLGNIWDNTNCASPPCFTSLDNGTDLTSYLPMTRFIYEHFGMVIMGILALSGIIMYGKYRFGGSGSSGGGQY